MEKKARKIGVKVLKIFGWIALSVIALLLLIIVAVQIPWVQNKIKQEAIAFLENKIGTPVRLEHFSISFPKKVVLHGFYMEDQQKDTLLYAGRLGIDTDLWSLTDNVIELNTIELDDFTSVIKRSGQDSAFNFDYIIKAFAQPEPLPVDTTAVPWEFRLDKVKLANLRLYFTDSLSGNHAKMRLGELRLSTEEFDLENSVIAFDEISVDNMRTEVIQTRAPETIPDTVEIVPEDSAAVAFNIGFRSLRLKNISADYEHLVTGQSLKMRFPSASVDVNVIDIKKQIIDLASVALNGPVIAFTQKHESKQVVSVDPVMKRHNESQGSWSFVLNSFLISDASLEYDNKTTSAVAQGFDPNHITLSDLNTRVSNISYQNENISANVGQFSFMERSGLGVRSMKGAVRMLRDSFALSDFVLNTTNSNLSADITAAYPSLSAAIDRPEVVNAVIDIQSSGISLKDLFLFDPALRDSIGIAVRETPELRFDIGARGGVASLEIERLQVHGLENTSIFANGSLRNLLDPEQLYFDISVDRFRTTRQDIFSVAADSLIPSNIQLPEWLSLTGEFQGTIDAPSINTTLTSDMGSVSVNAKLDLNENVRENYRGEVVIHEFNVGRLLRQESQMGKLDMVAAVNGSGISIEELNALMKVRVNTFEYNGYTYRDFRLNGSMKKYFFSGKASLSDENLSFVMTGDLDYNEDVPRYAFDFDLKNADLKKLKLTAEPIKARGVLEVNLATVDFKQMNGNVGIRKFAVYNGNALYAVDSLLFASIDQEGRSEISIRSDILSGDFKGTINIFTLPDLLNRHFNQYFSLRDTIYEKPVEDQHFEFDLVIKNTDLITEILLPGLEPFVPGEIKGEFDSADDKLDLSIKLSQINYSGLASDSVSLKVISDAESFDFTFSLKEILIDTLQIKTLRLAGNVMNDSIRTNLMILDSLEEEKYFIGGVFYSFEDAFQFSFLKNHLILNYEEWEAPIYNMLRFGDQGLDPNNFLIERGRERILLFKKNTPDSTLAIAFREVSLSNLTSLVEGTTPLSGVIDGDLTLASAQNSTFQTNLRVRDLAILEQTWGNLVLQVEKEGVSPLNFDLGLRGQNVEMSANGFFASGDDPVMLVRANIPRIEMSVLEPLTMGQLSEMKGILSGNVVVQGRAADPQISGQINFRDAAFVSSFANSGFSLPDETIYLRGDDFVFDQFEILDNRKNKAVIDGLVSRREAGGFNLGLRLTTRNFQLLNTTEKDNDLFFGNIRLNTSARITGTSNTPVISMNISLAENSSLTYVIPQEEKGIMDQKGIVVFIDKDAQNDPFMQSINPEDTIQYGFTGVQLTANLELTDDALFNVVIDPVTGDRLSVKGNSTLTLQMDPTGDVQLSGRYEISEGSYDLSFAKFVKRKFLIDKGSTITWSGDPLNADMNIRAIYEVETSPVDLVANRVSDEELATYRKPIPFQVYLKMGGQLLAPEISFELDMREEDRSEFGGNIYAQLKDINTRESDLNKQVFALLILKRFISDNPFESHGGGNLASSARSSVSKILSEQLNRLSSNVRGVELSFDLKSYEDYTAGGGRNQTELEVGVSKSLLNDRLVVKVSGNVDIEGENSQQNSFTDFIGDLALEYKLTEDGRLRVTGFRNTNYDLINGDIIETGAGLIYIKDYDTLSELFRANEERN